MRLTKNINLGLAIMPLRGLTNVTDDWYGGELVHQGSGIDKDGKQYEPTHKVQILGAVDLPNGDVQNELVDLKVESLSDWQSFRNKVVSVDIGIYAPAKNSVVYFIKKGTKPRLQTSVVD